MLLRHVSKFRPKSNCDDLRNLVTCNFTKSNTPPWVFSRFLIVQMVTNRATYHIFTGVKFACF